MTEVPLRVAIAGAGMIARVHLDAARRAGARITGISASTPERGRAAAAELGTERAFADSEELVTSDDVDVVHICTPNDSHRPLAELALRAGKHVVCEKPLATSAGDARALADLAASHGAVAAVPFVYRYHPMAAEARARVRSGALGKVRLLHGHYLQDWLSEQADNNWRVDAAVGGPSRAFADIGSHWCDLVEWVSGHRIAELTALTDTVLAERSAVAARTFSATCEADESGPAAPRQAVRTEDLAHVLFRTDLGASGTLLVSQVSPGRKNRLWFEVDGADASVTFDQENPESLLVGSRRTSETVVRDAAVLAPEAARLSVVPPGHPMGYRDCFAAFVADVHTAVRGGGADGGPSFPTFEDAARTAALTDAVLAAARTRTWTEVPTP
ncbi:Gfo/Idh/MocA family protein [Streptomyces meridianus]|uniref:Gfo/Idh/MocA family oxidoreductase n=1 Tax=Streptomyces meridianus TaxID=2938945 RepID=A0ABT0X3P7_9ACTN|nr:Gfo/Idh/MocA family oxidoreductase [Streptomyces meridianus]MCM2577164.1 Gfo/Idh/MocA family oxidoreductase [Streptomyces meridianus]